MGFSPNIKDREHAKFEENSDDGGTDVRVTLKSPIEVETQPGGSLVSGIEFDEIQATYPTALIEVYTYKEATITVATVTVTYTDASKAVLVSAVRT